MTFYPAAGGAYDVVLLISNQAPDPEVQPAAIMTLMGCMEASNFTDELAPKPVKGDMIELDDTMYYIYLVKDQRSGGTSSTNAFWLYLTQEEGN